MSGPDFGDRLECPSCGDMAEPEQDGDLLYWACGCGMEFGYQQTPGDPSCQLGIPEETRRFASGGVIGTGDGDTIHALLEPGNGPPWANRPVFLGEIGRRPEES